MPKMLFRVSAVLWLIWGVVHLFAGVMTVSLPTGEGFAGIADAVDRATIVSVAYPDAAGAVLRQHGWNLGWIGLTTMACCVYVWRGELWAVLLAALVGGMADIGYFVFMDLGGHTNFMPGTVMTIVSGTAVIASFVAAYQTRPDAAA